MSNDKREKELYALVTSGPSWAFELVEVECPKCGTLQLFLGDEPSDRETEFHCSLEGCGGHEAEYGYVVKRLVAGIWTDKIVFARPEDALAFSIEVLDETPAQKIARAKVELATAVKAALEGLDFTLVYYGEDYFPDDRGYTLEGADAVEAYDLLIEADFSLDMLPGLGFDVEDES